MTNTAKVECPNDGCSWSFEPDRMQEHLHHCRPRPAPTKRPKVFASVGRGVRSFLRGGYSARCHTCNREVRSETHERCTRCRWLVCACGACDYHCSARRG